MNEKKLTDDELLRLLEIFAKDDEPNGVRLLAEGALDLIYRLQDEKQKVVQDYYCEAQHCDVQKDIIAKQKAEIERLTEENEYLDGCAKQFLADYQNAQVQVDELTEQREVGREKLKNEIANKIFMSASHGAIQCGKMSIAIAEIEAEKYVEFAWEMVQQAVKDTAKEILKWLVGNKHLFNRTHEIGFEKPRTSYLIMSDEIEELAEKYGVVVK